MAYEHLQKLAETEPDNVKIYIRMANVAYMMEDYNAMSNACEKAMLIDKDMPELMYLYAQACIGLNDSSNAVAMLTKAINATPTCCAARRFLPTENSTMPPRMLRGLWRDTARPRRC